MAVYGLLAEFKSADALRDAVRGAVAQGYRRIEAYAPFPVQEVMDALPPRPDRIPLITLVGAIVGGVGGYFMQWYSATVSYPINAGGRPPHSWPSFIPITFEMTVLGAVLAAVLGMLILNRLPELRHPLFAVPGFDRASRDRFFLCIRGDDALFEPEQSRRFMLGLGAEAVSEVEP